MAHPQNSPRGLFAKRSIILADASGNTVTLTNGASGLLLSGGLALSGEATDIITQNSTAVTFPSQIRLSGTSRFIVANSTGLLIGGRYISTNTTGNLTT